MMTTWSDNDSADSDEEHKVANLCLMAIDEPKVISNPSVLNE